ncbi:MAG: DegT/DnrJ/EryC1/StrS family aminotransferase [Candidatus Omnitrophota bacterium]
MNKKRSIPVCEPLYLGNEEKYASDAIRSRWISSGGNYIKRFEERFSKFCGARYGIATTSGTAALHLALKATGVKEGDEVIIPDFAMIAVLFAVLYCGAKPVFVDAEKHTWNMDVAGLEKKITSRTKAIIPVHTYGHPVNMGPVVKMAKKHDLYVVEDAAEAHGAQYKGRVCGSIGHIACFSFYANKIITSGEGGMVVTSSLELAEKCRYYKNLCFPLRGKRDYIHDDLGFNYRMTNVQAALGLAQLENINKFIKRRRDNAKLYTELLKKVPGITLPTEEGYAKNVYWMYGIVIDPVKFGKTRDELVRALLSSGIDTRYFFKPLHKQGALKKVGLRYKDRYPQAEHLSRSGLYLPSGSGLTAKEIKYISAKITEIQGKA